MVRVGRVHSGGNAGELRHDRHIAAARKLCRQMEPALEMLRVAFTMTVREHHERVTRAPLEQWR